MNKAQRQEFIALASSDIGLRSLSGPCVLMLKKHAAEFDESDVERLITALYEKLDNGKQYMKSAACELLGVIIPQHNTKDQLPRTIVALTMHFIYCETLYQRTAYRVLRLAMDHAQADILNGLKEFIIALLDNEQEETRATACTILGDIAARTEGDGLDILINYLIERTHDNRIGVWGYACRALGQASTCADVKQRAVILKEIVHMSQNNSWVTESAHEALHLVCSRAKEAELIPIVRDLLEQLKHTASWQLPKGTYETIAIVASYCPTLTSLVSASLIENLRIDDWERRDAICWALGTMGAREKDEKKLRDIITAFTLSYQGLNDYKWQVCWSSCRIMTTLIPRVNENDVTHIIYIVDKMNPSRIADEYGYIRQDSCLTFGAAIPRVSTESKQTEIVSTLRHRALFDVSSDVRKKACRALGSALPHVSEYLSMEIIDILLEKIQGKRKDEKIQGKRKDEDYFVLSAAIEGLGNIPVGGTERKKVIDSLLTLQQNDNKLDLIKTLSKLAHKSMSSSREHVIISFIQRLNSHDENIVAALCSEIIELLPLLDAPKIGIVLASLKDNTPQHQLIKVYAASLLNEAELVQVNNVSAASQPKPALTLVYGAGEASTTVTQSSSSELSQKNNLGSSM